MVISVVPCVQPLTDTAIRKRLKARIARGSRRGATHAGVLVLVLRFASGFSPSARDISILDPGTCTAACRRKEAWADWLTG